jgi:hypothetical protein
MSCSKFPYTYIYDIASKNVTLFNGLNQLIINFGFAIINISFMNYGKYSIDLTA